MIDYKMLLVSFTAGMGVFLNPCGFPMLPPFIAAYLARAGRGPGRSWLHETAEGLRIGLITSAGFISFFAVIGLVLAYLERRLRAYMPWLAVLIGAALVVLGLMMLLERKGFSLPLQRLAQAVTRGPERGLPFFFLYGVSYSIVALGCTWPFFLVVIHAAADGGLLNGAAQFAAYSLGMALLMVALAVLTALYKGFIYKHLQTIMIYVRRASAIVLILAGGYIIYYQVKLLLAAT